MSTTTDRLSLLIDVFELRAQPALVLPNLLPRQLIAAILDEFRFKGQQAPEPTAGDGAANGLEAHHYLNYLSNQAADYRLIKTSNGAELRDDVPLGEQVAAGDRLVLIEHEVAPPAGAASPSRPIYLRELTTGSVYRLPWMPAIIGRPDANREQNDLVAVNLSPYLKWQYVSRRHAQIIEADGAFFVEPLSPNPTSLHSNNSHGQRVLEGRALLRQGDIIVLDSSEIALQVIQRQEETA